MNIFSVVKRIKRVQLVLIMTVLCGFYSNAMGASKFSWLPNSEPGIAGYRIYYSQTDGGPYLQFVDVGNPAPVDGRIQGEVPGLDCGKTYYFVCRAYNLQGNESDNSTQIELSVTALPVDAPAELIVEP